MFHQIYELMVLGMHPAIPHPRRSQIAPTRLVAAFYCKGYRGRSTTVDNTNAVFVSATPGRLANCAQMALMRSCDSASTNSTMSDSPLTT